MRHPGRWGAVTLLSATLLGPLARAEDAPLLRLGHYSTGNGLAGFVLDRQAVPAKLRFDGSEEIIALTPVRASGNTTLLEQDDGSALLRLDDRGGVILYTAAAREGEPAFLDQKATPLALPPGSKQAAEAAAERSRQQLRDASGIDLPTAFETGLDEQSPDWAQLADAATVVGVALQELARTPLGRDAVAKKIDHVVIRTMPPVGLVLEGKTLVVMVAQDRPITGRPSSALIRTKLEELL
jgi:hypothetical protein